MLLSLIVLLIFFLQAVGIAEEDEVSRRIVSPAR